MSQLLQSAESHKVKNLPQSRIRIVPKKSPLQIFAEGKSRLSLKFLISLILPIYCITSVDIYPSPF